MDETTRGGRPPRAGVEEDAGRQVIARAASILRTLEAAPAGLSIAEITRAAGLPRTTVTRLVGSLQAEQLVEAGHGTVRLGPALMRLAAAVRLDAVAMVRPHLEALAAETGETADLWIDRGDTAELVDEVTSVHELRIAADKGFRLPLGTTAPGKAFLAGLSEPEVVRRLGGRLERRTAQSLGSVEALLAELAEVRRTGLATDLEEHAEDVSALAMVVDLGLAERYAIAIPTPARRMQENRDRLEAALRACVEAIEVRR